MTTTTTATATAPAQAAATTPTPTPTTTITTKGTVPVPVTVTIPIIIIIIIILIIVRSYQAQSSICLMHPKPIRINTTQYLQCPAVCVLHSLANLYKLLITPNVDGFMF